MKIAGNVCFCLVISLLLPAAMFAGGGQSASRQAGSAASAVKVNPTGFPIVNETITLSVFGSRDQNHADWSEMFFFKEYEKKTNIHLDLQEVPAQGFEEKKNLLFASNELPDIFLRAALNREQISMYGTSSSQLMPLESLVQQWAPNVHKIYQSDEFIRQTVTAADGHIYTIPEIDISDTGRMDFKQWINKEWLAAVGKNIPVNLQEFKDVLIAFRDKDPNKNGQNDEIPLGIREPSSVYVLGGPWGLDYQMRDTINIQNGKLHYWLTDTAFREYLQFLHELYAEKLIWQNYYKAGNRPEWRSNLSNALYGTFYMPYSDVFINVENQFTGYPPLVGPRGDQFWPDSFSTVPTPGAFALSNTSQNPEAALRWVDYFFTEEGALFYRYGIEGQTFYFDSRGMPRINDSILNSPEGFMTALGKINLVPGKGGPNLTTSQTDGIVASDLTKEVAAGLIKYLRPIVSKPPVTEIEQERVNAILQDLIKYRDESVTKFIIGEWGFDRWDEYSRTLERIGLRELEAIYQKAYDARK